MRIVIRIIGAVVGAAFGFVTCFELLPVLCGGNMLAAGFLFLPGAVVSLIGGGFAGAISATRVTKHLDRPATAAQRRSRRILVVSLLVGIPSAFVAVVWIGREAMEPPSDAAMLRHFERHEATCTTLAQMATVDKGLDRVDENWTMPVDTNSVGVSTERLDIYRSQLAEPIGIDFGGS
jgi:hypothetical protein